MYWPWPATWREPKIAAKPMKKSATSPSRAVSRTNRAITEINKADGTIQLGGAPRPPGFVRIIESTSPPGSGRPGSSRILDG